MTALCKLSVSCNNLTSLPPELGLVNSLKFLDVSFNSLTTLPLSLAQLTELQAFNGAFNPLGSGGADVAASDPKDKTRKKASKQQNPTTLQQHNVGDLPPVLFELLALRELNLDYTGCRNIDIRFGRLSKLRALQV